MIDNINRRILVIDDNRAIHDDFRKILASRSKDGAFEEISADFFGDNPKKSCVANFELDSAFQGRQGLEMVTQAVQEGRPYGVAFVDVRMPPGWDGIETTAKLWEVCPELQVVICTAYSDYDWEAIAHKLGQTDRLLILKKPFDTTEVLQMAETLAQKWTLARQASLRMSDLEAMVNQRTQELRASNEQLAQEIAVRRQAQTLLSAFSDLGLLLGAATTIRKAAEIILETARCLIGFDGCMLDLYSAESDLLTPVLHADLNDGKLQERSFEKNADFSPPPLARKALLEGGQLAPKSQAARRLPTDQAPATMESATAAQLVVPIRNGQFIIGILSIQSHTTQAYLERDVATLQALADHCGGALNRIRIEEALRSTEEQLRQSQKLEAVGQLAGGVAHDFNSLLTVIEGNAELARSLTPECSAEVAQNLDEICAAAERAASLTKQLLAFSRQQLMRSKPVDVDGVITNLIKMLKRRIGEGVELRRQSTDGLPSVRADIGMIEQALTNLVLNAWDAMPGGGQLSIATELVSFDQAPDQAHPEARPGDFVCVAVKDTGVGISPENLPRIFEPFFTTKDVGKGTGLGLATVYGIVKQHEGWIEVSSQVGVGSTFRIYLPALKATPPASTKATRELAGLSRGNPDGARAEAGEVVCAVSTG